MRKQGARAVASGTFFQGRLAMAPVGALPEHRMTL